MSRSVPVVVICGTMIAPEAKDGTKIKYDFEAAVIGSGFGGSIAAIELAKVFQQEKSSRKGLSS